MDLLSNSLNDNTMEQQIIPGSNYGFSSVAIDQLGALEQTLVTILVDISGSTAPFKKQMESCIGTIVKSFNHSPRKNNLLLRVVMFGTVIKELHGFKLLVNCKPEDYNGALLDGGATALFEGIINSSEAMLQFAKTLGDNDYLANGFFVCLTDGQENQSGSASAAKKALHRAQQEETLEQLISILVGVNSNGNLDKYLSDVKDQVGFDQFVGMGASEKDFAKLANFIVSNSVSLSNSLQTGTDSQLINF
jgi:hypothetical protein